MADEPDTIEASARYNEGVFHLSLEYAGIEIDATLPEGALDGPADLMLQSFHPAAVQLLENLISSMEEEQADE